MTQQLDLRPGGLRLSIMTAPRRPAYIHDTLDDIVKSCAAIASLGSIDLIIDAHRESGYLSELDSHPLFNLVYLTDRQLKAQEKRHVGWRFCFNYWRCLNLPVDGYWGLAVLEDDVRVRPGFIEKLIATVEEIRARQNSLRIGPNGLQQFLLALYTAYNFEREPSFYRGRHFCSYGYPFFGTCGLFFEASVVHRVRDHMCRFGVEEHRIPGDLVLNELKASGDLWMYACTRDLVQHVGVVSTGLGQGAASYSSFSFDKPWGPVRKSDWGRA